MMESPRARRVVVCDDSPAFTEALRRFLERDPALDVVGAFHSGEALVAEAGRLAPDLVIVDLEMPGMSGEEAISRLMSEQPVPILVLSAHAGPGSGRGAEALAAGALETMQKGGLRLDRPSDVWATAVRGRIKRLAAIQLHRRNPAIRAVQPPASGLRSVVSRTARAVVVGASTGGPPALASLLGSLPRDFPIPIVVVQHMPVGFIDGFAEWLDRTIALPARVAEAGKRASPGVWFAPDDAHLTLDASLRFDTDAHGGDGTHRPSVDVLFKSAAALAEEVVGVVLTGMGRDGGAGTAAIRQAGGHVIAQDEETSAVFGMPRKSAEAGADQVLPLHEIAGALAGLKSKVPSR
jgi:two-component system chemotaxis response regulator CheB